MKDVVNGSVKDGDSGDDGGQEDLRGEDIVNFANETPTQLIFLISNAWIQQQRPRCTSFFYVTFHSQHFYSASSSFLCLEGDLFGQFGLLPFMIKVSCCNYFIELTIIDSSLSLSLSLLATCKSNETSRSLIKAYISSLEISSPVASGRT